MNSFNGFTEEELAALVPWRLPLMDEELAEIEADGAENAPASDMEEEVECASLLTAREIEAMQKQAYDEAAAQGREDGLAEGREQGLAEGREQGYREGFEEGRRQSLEESRDAAQLYGQRFGELMESLHEPLRQVDEQVEGELVALAIAIARQLIRRELHTDPGEVVAVAKVGLAALPANARKVSLHVHPDDAHLIRTFLAADEAGQRWKIVEDPLLSRGGCKVCSETSRIDATVEKRLAAVIAGAFGGEREKDGW